MITDLPKDLIRLLLTHYIHWTSLIDFLSTCRKVRFSLNPEELRKLFKRNTLRLVYFAQCEKRYYRMLSEPLLEIDPIVVAVPPEYQLIQSLKHARYEYQRFTRHELLFADFMNESEYRQKSDDLGGVITYSALVDEGFEKLIRYPLFMRLEIQKVLRFREVDDMVQRVHSHACLELLEVMRSIDIHRHGMENCSIDQGFPHDEILEKWIVDMDEKCKITCDCGSRIFRWCMFIHHPLCLDTVVTCTGCHATGRREQLVKSRHDQFPCWNQSNLQCSICDDVTLASFNWDRVQFESHVVSCEGMADVKCKYCAFTCGSYEILMCHQDKCGLYRFNCIGCGKSFQRKDGHNVKQCSMKKTTDSYEIVKSKLQPKNRRYRFDMVKHVP
uniref:Uncharacterized protein n=1 Tax=viral metagenome TaxID=1070528 RepID=A0A6C0BNX3_9ZZZZ